MSLLFRYFLVILLTVRCVISAEPDQPAQEPPKDTPAIENNNNQEAPPAEPVEAPIKKRRRARPQQQLREVHHPNAVFGEHVVVKAGETIDQLVLLGGSADIQGTVERELVVIGGNANVAGTVQGDVVVVGGVLQVSGEVHRQTTAVLSRVQLNDTAKLDRGAFFLGGPFIIPPSATILGERVVIPFGDVLPKIEGLKAWLTHGLLWGRLLPIGVHWAWVVAAFFIGVYFLTLILFPAAVKAIFLALEDRPVTSILSGFLTLILFAPLVAILAIAVVGIPVIPFLQVALILALLFGKAAVMCFLGRSFGRSASATFLQAPLAAFVVGASLLVLAYMIPVFGLLAWILATVFGLGGAVIAIARTFKREEGTVPPARVLVAPRPNLSAVAVAAGAAGTAPEATIGSPEIAPPPISAPPAIPTADTLLLPRVGFWKRLLATLLDFVLLGFLVPVLGKGFIPVAVFYFVAMWTWKGTTIGSILLRLKIVRTDGTPVTFAVALVRSLSSFFSLLVLGLGFLWTAWDREKQSWHDKIAGTIVVQMPKGFALL